MWISASVKTSFAPKLFKSRIGGTFSLGEISHSTNIVHDSIDTCHHIQCGLKEF